MPVLDPQPPGRLVPEIHAARRAFPVTQELLAGSPSADALELECGWHDTSMNIESGAFALVRAGAGLTDLVGDIVEVIAPAGLSVFVFVLQEAAVPTDFSLARRAWMAISRPSVESLECSVVTVR